MAAICLLAPAGAHAATATFLGESIDITDGTQTDRLNQTGPSSCTTPKTAQLHGDSVGRHFDTFTFRNISPNSLCVTVTLNTACSGGILLMSAAYSGTAQPANLTTGFLGHLGSPAAGQASYGFNVPANTDFVVSVAPVTSDGCDSYDLTVHVPFAPNALERDDGLTAGDPTQTGRPRRTGIASTCAAPTTNPPLDEPTTAFRYDAFTFTNIGSAPSCVTASIVAPTCSFGTAQSVAYLDSFNPASPVSHFLAAQNASSDRHYVPAYSFTVPAGRTFVVVMSAAENGACGAYHLSVDGSNVVNGVPSPVPGKGAAAGTNSGEGVLASVSGLAFSSKTFAAESSGPSAYSAKKKPPAGTKVSYTLNEAATVRFTVKRRAKGRKLKRGKKTVCVKPTKKNRKRKRCTRVITLKGSFSRDGVAGKNSFHFTGRLRGRKLKPGRYRLVATPSTGGQKGKPTSRAFRIVR